MKLLRYGLPGLEKPGLLADHGQIHDLSEVIPDLAGESLLPESIEKLRRTNVSALPVVSGQPRIGPCVGSVGKFVCIGLNYSDHAKEAGMPIPVEPVIFMKATSAICGPDDDVVIPRGSTKMDWEVELGVVIGKTCFQPAADVDIRQFILGYTCVNDVTARDLQNKDGQWTRAKGFDTFCPVGPVVTTEIDPWAGVGVETRVNDAVKQQGNTRDFIFALDVVIRHIARAMTLFPGDLIPTGTPSGVGALAAGDVVEVRVDGVGTLRNSVVDES